MRWASLAVLIAAMPIAGCGTADQPCSTPDATQCHALTDAHVTVTGSAAVSGEVQREWSEGSLCRSSAAPGTLWQLPLPAIPTAVDGHFFYAEGSILAASNTGPGTYPASALLGFEIDVDDSPPFVPGGGSVTIASDGSGSMNLNGFTNGSGQINVSATWTCSDVR
ncbi:MAG: hypothetical protein JOY68_05360, partial [Candidatus Dormibacteraeota bacterium]|nr:hypothetical protein [Candidatus Dormibacteraeota bacterium]